MSTEYIKVAVDAPLLEPLTYLPGELGDLKRGQSVIVPLGKRTTQAVVVGHSETAGPYKLKAIQALDETRPILPASYLNWIEWLARYYVHPVGQVTALAFPPLKKSDKESRKKPIVPQMPAVTPPTLNHEQQKCCDDILKISDFSVHLLYGVTGSGKTEVYLRLIQQVMRQNKSAIVLVPEISLTPQLIKRFSERFPEQISVLHSHLTDREKTNQWWQAIEGKTKILIGARSALFCPIQDLGLIIIDEEHEPSFKQDEKLKYHARDAAIMLAKFNNCPIVLGSATPSLESWQNAREGKYHLHQLTKRVMERALPNIEVVDLRLMREEQKEAATALPFWLSPQLYKALDENLHLGKQSALFLNRRGMAQMLVCSGCGYVHECPNCAICLTLHAHRHLVCHYCDYTEELPEVCTSCKVEEPKPLGVGTELIESDIKKLFPNAVVSRADRDEINSREHLEQLIEAMETGKIDILIGTQMIAKGLDFQGLTLVGLVLADVGFNLPDFRSSERSFQILTQMSGRSGRHVSDPGQVIIQTYNTEHPSIVSTKANDFIGFAERELASRKELHYPPFGRLAALRIQGLHHDRVRETSHKLVQRGEQLKKLQKLYEPIDLLGPAPAPLVKLRQKYRYHVLVKAPSVAVLTNFSHQLMADLSWVLPGTKVQIDIDPLNML